MPGQPAAPPTGARIRPGSPPDPAGTGGRHRARLWTGLVAALVGLAAVVATLVITRPGPVAGLLGARRPPATLVAGAPPTAGPVLPAAATGAPLPVAERVAAELGPSLADPALGGHVGASVIDVLSGQELYGRAATTPLLPASTAKLLTAVGALATRGPAYRLATRAVAGSTPGEVVLVGGGDPTLSVGANGSYPDAARLDVLAAQVKKALGGTVPTRVIIDGSLFAGPVVGPRWLPEDLDIGYTSRVTALMTDAGRVDPADLADASLRFTAPDLAAGRAFARLLGLPETAVARGTAPGGTAMGGPATGGAATGGAATASAPAAGAAHLGAVYSPPLVRLVEYMLSASDNVIAEALARQVALAGNQPASFAGAAEAVTSLLAGLGLPTGGVRLADGSGLSTDNRLTAALLARSLTLAAGAGHPELHGLFAGLPVAGYSGTLADRYRSAGTGTGAAGAVRAKTGTLTGVTTLAGVTVDADGRLLAFAFMANGVDAGQTRAAQAALDRAAGALTGCGCR